MERNHDPLGGIIFHDKRMHDGRFAEYFNLGRKALVSTDRGVHIL